MNISEKVAFLKGLAEGLEISSDSKNGKLIKGILDVLEDIADSVESLEDDSEFLEDYITEIDEDLGILEDDFEDVKKTCGKKIFEPENKKSGLDAMNICEDEPDYDDLDDDALLDGIVEIKCPKCGGHIFVETDDLLDGGYIECSECGGEITVLDDMGDLQNGCSCGHCPAQNGGGDDDDNLKFEEQDDGLKF